MNCSKCDERMLPDKDARIQGAALRYSISLFLIVMVLIGFMAYHGFDRWISIFVGVLIIFCFKLGLKFYICRKCKIKRISIWGQIVDK